MRIITDEELDAAYKAATEEAKRWRTVALHGMESCVAVRDQNEEPLCHDPSSIHVELGSQERVNCASQQCAGELIQRRMILAALRTLSA